MKDSQTALISNRFSYNDCGSTDRDGEEFSHAEGHRHPQLLLTKYSALPMDKTC